MIAKPAALSQVSVLVVEDEYLTASSLIIELEKIGAEVVGPVSNVDDALTLLAQDRQFDCAILDVNLRGIMGFAVAEKLVERNVPFVFVTGYSCGSLPESFRSAPCLTKPCDDRELLEMLMHLTIRPA